jgi:hypothetical protein
LLLYSSYLALGVFQLAGNLLGFITFLDAYSGYNQIKLKKEDEEKTTFITPYGVFCYQVMHFGLKNAGATYQRMMQNYLGNQIG